MGPVVEQCLFYWESEAGVGTSIYFQNIFPLENRKRTQSNVQYLTYSMPFIAHIFGTTKILFSLHNARILLLNLTGIKFVDF